MRDGKRSFLKPFRALGGALDAADGWARRFLGARAGLWVRLGIGIAATAVFWILASSAPLAQIDEYLTSENDQMRFGMTLLLTGLFVISLIGLFRMAAKHGAAPGPLAFLSAAWIATLMTRVAMFDFISYDYLGPITGWLEEMIGSSFGGAFSQPLGDYNPSYMYLLFGLTNIPLPNMYLVKTLSVCFDFVAAFFVMRLVALKTDSFGARLGALFAVLWLPTVLLNGAHWAQCDVIFTSMALGGLLFALTDRPYRSVIFFALSLAFKLQAIFLLPLIAPLFAMRKLSLKHLLCFPLVYFATLVPAWISGQTLRELLEIYVQQLGAYQQPTLEAPSIFALFAKAPYDTFANAGVYLALGATAAVCAILCRRGSALSIEQMICSAMLFSMMIPLLLPAMHERYFFLADVVGIVYLFWFPKRWYTPVSMAAASFLSYHIIYRYEDRIVPLEYLAVMLAVTAGLCAMHLARLLREPKQNLN